MQITNAAAEDRILLDKLTLYCNSIKPGLDKDKEASFNVVY